MSNPGVSPNLMAAGPESTASQGGLTEGARIINTFVDPPKTFTDLRRRSNWFVPFILISLFSYALVFAAAQKIGFEQLSENQMRLNHKRMEQIENLPADQQARSREIGVTITKAISYAIPAFFLLVAVIIAAVLMATFNFGMGAEIAFAQSMAIVMYAHLPGMVKAVLAIVSIYAGASPESFIFQNPVASNPGALVDAAAHPALFALLSSLDIFAIWTLVLTGIGFACVSKLKRSTTIGVVFAWYALWTLVQTGLAALTS